MVFDKSTYNMEYKKGWRTDNEIKHIDWLARLTEDQINEVFSYLPKEKRPTVERILQGYIKSAKHRLYHGDWGDVNGERAIEHAEEYLLYRNLYHYKKRIK